MLLLAAIYAMELTCSVSDRYLEQAVVSTLIYPLSGHALILRLQKKDLTSLD